MEHRERIEKEFGVAIPGEILDPAFWTKTALKRLPAEGPLELVSIFGREAPLILDVGCGNGRFLLGSALARPDHDHIGIDILPVVIRYATRRGNQRGLTNLRFAVCDGERFLRQYLGPASVAEVHCYHPQPFHDQRRASRRLLAPDFLALVVRALGPGGKFFIQTDNAGYWSYLLEVLPRFFDFHALPGRWPDAPKGRTRREIVALQKGLAVHRGWGTVLAGLDAEEAARIAITLPAPDFDAGHDPLGRYPDAETGPE